MAIVTLTSFLRQVSCEHYIYYDILLLQCMKKEKMVKSQVTRFTYTTSYSHIEHVCWHIVGVHVYPAHEIRHVAMHE